MPATCPSPTPKRRPTRHSIPAVLMRSGTSKGLFLHRAALPAAESHWAGPLLAIMGSRHRDARQLDGVGGASSVTSKVAVVAPSRRPGVHVDYTFVQVAVGSESVDLSGNCGNMCAGVGPFAVQEGLVTVPLGARAVDVRIFNTNTQRLVEVTVEVDEDGDVVEDGEYHIPGVKAPGSEIRVAFVEPAGSMTGRLFPSGRRSETIRLGAPIAGATAAGLSVPPFDVDVTLVDAANPFVVVDAETLPASVRGQPRDSPLALEVAEAIRRAGAVRMGLAASVEAAARVRGTPKLAYVSRPVPPSPLPLSKPSTDGSFLVTPDDIPSVAAPADIQILAYSMGKPHPSLQLTGGVCLASAVTVEGTVAHRLSTQKGRGKSELPFHDDVALPPTPRRTPSPSSSISTSDSSLVSGATKPTEDLPGGLLGVKRRVVRLAHDSGVMEVETWTRPAGEAEEPVIERCVISRTARRLFEGNVLYYAEYPYECDGHGAT
ncbi:uncharacterized protein PG998_010148 [Apiospora kogelbergensis]|uniref:uncharacterized protein n=1 Tax=Apiospora kogelbergensis TaxID=1337665 RepID=UPI0031321DF7